MEVRGAPWRSVEVRGGLHGGPWRLHGGLHGGLWISVEVSIAVRGGSMEVSMEVRGAPWNLHGGSWSSVEVSMEVRGDPWRSPWRSAEVH